jgi:hypothetical protein
MKHLTKLNYEEVKKVYLNSKNLREAAKILGCGRSKLQKFCKENNIKRPFIFNHESFSKINELSCYWGGFIAADGCVYRNVLKIGLNEIDIEHINKFASFIQHKNIYIYHYKKGVHYSTKSKRLIEDLLKNFNITSKKSLTLKPPLFYNEFFCRNFILGFSDGDGCICWSKNQIFFSITCASEVFLIWLNDMFYKYLGIRKNIYRKSKKYFSLVWQGKDATVLLNWLYENSNKNFRLDRKFEKYREVLWLYKIKQDEIIEKKRKLQEEIDKMVCLYKNGLTYGKISEEMKIKKSKVFYHLSKIKTLKKFKGNHKNRISLFF